MAYGEIPAIQAEQVADDVAPVMAEYVPAKASDEEHGLVDSKTSTHVKSRTEEARRLEGENTFDNGSENTFDSWGGDHV